MRKSLEDMTLGMGGSLLMGLAGGSLIVYGMHQKDNLTETMGAYIVMGGFFLFIETIREHYYNKKSIIK